MYKPKIEPVDKNPKSLPYAYAVLVPTKTSYCWVVMDCPYCSSQHVHSGGPIGDDPYTEHLKSRISHCFAGDYLLYNTGRTWRFKGKSYTVILD